MKLTNTSLIPILTFLDKNELLSLRPVSHSWNTNTIHALTLRKLEITDQEEEFARENEKMQGMCDRLGMLPLTDKQEELIEA